MSRIKVNVTPTDEDTDSDVLRLVGDSGEFVFTVKAGEVFSIGHSTGGYFAYPISSNIWGFWRLTGKEKRELLSLGWTDELYAEVKYITQNRPPEKYVISGKSYLLALTAQATEKGITHNWNPSNGAFDPVVELLLSHGLNPRILVRVADAYPFRHEMLWQYLPDCLHAGGATCHAAHDGTEVMSLRTNALDGCEHRIYRVGADWSFSVIVVREQLPDGGFGAYRPTTVVVTPQADLEALDSTLDYPSLHMENAFAQRRAAA